MDFEKHQQLVDLLESYRFSFRSERDLQDGVEGVLGAGGLEFEREVRLNARDRIDFMVGSIGLEVKIAGSATNLLRQLARYAEHERVDSLVVVTSRTYLACVGQAEFGDKAVSAVITSRRAF